MFCPKCGYKNQEGVKFCRKCGEPLADLNAVQKKSNETSSATAAPQTAAPTSAPVSTVPIEAVEKKQEKIAFVLGIIAASLTIVPIPLLSWFSCPCALVGIIFPIRLWKQANLEKKVPTMMTVAAIVLCGFAIIDLLAFTMSGKSVDIITSIFNNFANGLGKGFTSGIR